MVDMNNALKSLMVVSIMISNLSNVFSSQISTAEKIIGLIDPTYPPQGNNDVSVNATAAITPVIFDL